MKEGYKVNKTIGSGKFIEVYNYISLNEVGHYRFSTEIRVGRNNSSIIGIWKPKTI